MWMIGSLLLLLVAVAHAVVAEAARPHILLMVLDDIGRADTGVYGRSNIPMPNLVSLAKEGTVLENLYTQPVCSPTRTSLLAGRYPFRKALATQHFTTILPGMAAGIPLDTPILPELLRDAGYDTHMIGKWHCGYATWQHTPFYRGFSSFRGFLQAQGDYVQHSLSVLKLPVVGEVLSGYDYWSDDKPMWSARGKHSLDLYDERITQVLSNYSAEHATPEQRAAHPLFVYFAHQTVHIPLQPRKKEPEERCAHLAKHASRRLYCSMLVELDDSIGSTVAQYKQHGLWDNTLLLLLTDNGGMVNFDAKLDGMPNFPASQGSNYPLRGSKTTLFDGGVRSLGFISGGFYPRRLAGRRYTGLAHVVDLTATALSVAGLYPAKREKLKLDGTDLWPLLLGLEGGSPRVEVPINIVKGGLVYSAVRWGKYKFISSSSVKSAAGLAFGVSVFGWFDRNGDILQLAQPGDEKISMLFDLEKDPEERRNLAGELPDLVQHGMQLIASYVKGGDYMPPQESKRVRLAGLPTHGVWAPFMSTKEWRRNFARQQRAADIVGLNKESEEEDEDRYVVSVKDDDGDVTLLPHDPAAEAAAAETVAAVDA